MVSLRKKCKNIKLEDFTLNGDYAVAYVDENNWKHVNRDVEYTLTIKDVQYSFIHTPILPIVLIKREKGKKQVTDIFR